MPASAIDSFEDQNKSATKPDWIDEPTASSFEARLDEAAQAMHPIGLIRSALVLFGGLAAMLLLGWPAGTAWVACALGIEAWSWFATRVFVDGRAIDQRSRLNFAANYVVMNLSWLLLGGLFWLSGGVAGHASALAIFLGLAGIMILLFHNVPAVFLAAGAAPATGALSVVMLADGRGWLELAPIWMTILLGLVFCIGRAFETPSRQQFNRRLKRSLHRFRVLAENVPDVFARFDMEGRFIYASPASLTVLGYSSGKLVGRFMGELLRPHDPQTVQAMIECLIAAPAQSHVFTSLIRHKDDRWLWIQTSIKLVHEGGVPMSFIGVMRDVTEQVAADAALQTAKSEAESANRVKSQFLANISHEFQTPMNGVLGALHLLDAETLSPEGRQLLQNAKDCGRSLSQLLNDVLDFSRMGEGQLRLSPEPVHVGEILESAANALKAEAARKNVELRSDITGVDLWIAADPAHLRQAMYSLVANAVKFTAKGHVIAKLQVETLPGARRRVRLEVEDTGVGIPPEVQTLLFDDFRQADGRAIRCFGGIGLGLPLTRAIVAMMGGEIGFSSAEGVGSRFWITFEAPAVQEASTTVDSECGILDGLNILLVEDNPNNRLVARTMLVRLGAAVEDADDGLAGLEAAGRGAHDLILMDIQMPRMDGVEAARAIRRLPGTASQVPIIALTANVMTHQKAEYIAAGMNGVVAKPISPAALLSEIARVSEREDTRLAG